MTYFHLQSQEATCYLIADYNLNCWQLQQMQLKLQFNMAKDEEWQHVIHYVLVRENLVTWQSIPNQRYKEG